MNKLLFFLGFTVFTFIIVNRILCNENYQDIFDVGYFYHLFCAKIEQNLFIKSLGNIISKIDKTKNVLDFGCGPGIMSIFFSNNYVGVDIDKTRIEYAQQMYPEKTFIKLNTGIPYANNYFDFILLNDCIHHIDNYEMSNIISELFRVLKVG